MTLNDLDWSFNRANSDRSAELTRCFLGAAELLVQTNRCVSPTGPLKPNHHSPLHRFAANLLYNKSA